jgi:hypothetical protein
LPNAPSPPIYGDDQVQQSLSHGHGNQSPTPAPHSLSQSLSPQAGSKQQHNTEEEENDSDIEDVHVNKVPKIQNKTARPKAGDYDEVGKELVLAAANIYRALLASQGAFLNSSESKELKLIMKSWKLVNAESEVNQLALTPSIVTIVSIFL